MKVTTLNNIFFNEDKIALFWKKITTKAFIARKEKSMPGFKTSRDSRTLLLGANADVSVN